MILLKNAEEIALIHKASRIVAEILEELAAAVKPGVTTEELDWLAEELTYRKGARPAFKGYKPHNVAYPKTSASRSTTRSSTVFRRGAG